MQTRYTFSHGGTTYFIDIFARNFYLCCTMPHCSLHKTHCSISLLYGHLVPFHLKLFLFWAIRMLFLVLLCARLKEWIVNALVIGGLLIEIFPTAIYDTNRGSSYIHMTEWVKYNPKYDNESIVLCNINKIFHLPNTVLHRDFRK